MKTAVHQFISQHFTCFASKTLSKSFCLQIICIHVCWSYCFSWHFVTQS